MTTREQYTSGPASGAQVRKDGEKWTLILVRELHHAPEKVWQALTDPAHIREWAPFDADGSLATAGATVNLTWAGTGRPQVTKVTRADAPEVLEYGDIRWELEAFGGGTHLTLWHKHRSPLHFVGRRGLAHLFRCSGSPSQRNIPSAASLVATRCNSAAGSG